MLKLPLITNVQMLPVSVTIVLSYSRRISALCSCAFCEKHFKSLEDLRQHVHQFHLTHITEETELSHQVTTDAPAKARRPRSRPDRGSDPKRRNCDRCELTFCSQNSLKTHVRIVHDNIKDFQCGVCEASFATVSGVKRHLVHHHNLGRRRRLIS